MRAEESVKVSDAYNIYSRIRKSHRRDSKKKEKEWSLQPGQQKYRRLTAWSRLASLLIRYTHPSSPALLPVLMCTSSFSFAFKELSLLISDIYIIVACRRRTWKDWACAEGMEAQRNPFPFCILSRKPLLNGILAHSRALFLLFLASPSVSLLLVLTVICRLWKEQTLRLNEIRIEPVLHYVPPSVCSLLSFIPLLSISVLLPVLLIYIKTGNNRYRW